MRSGTWPDDAQALKLVQVELARGADLQAPWKPTGPVRVGATFVASEGERLWAAAVVYEAGIGVAAAVAEGRSSQPYVPGLLALREGPILERAVRSLAVSPDVLIVNATGRDHPRGAGLALQLGAVLGLPTVGVTDRPLVADGPAPDLRAGSVAPLELDGLVVGARLRTRTAVRPLCVHTAWRTEIEVAVDLVRRHVRRVRTPRPLREARRLAREARAKYKSDPG